MTLQRRNIMTLSCDAACGTRLVTEAETAISARLEAGRKGWRYIDGAWLMHPEDRSKFHKGNDRKQTVRGIDLCPDCDVPAPESQLPKQVNR